MGRRRLYIIMNVCIIMILLYYARVRALQIPRMVLHVTKQSMYNSISANLTPGNA